MRSTKRATRVGVCLAVLALAASAPAGATGGGGDANNDGKDDLAISGSYEDVGALGDAGAVTILPAGKTAGAKQLHADSAGVAGTAEAGDSFGYDPVWGDFNGDGYDDLAVGAPYEDVGALNSAGAVVVLKGRSTGLTATGSVQLIEDTPGMAGTSEADDDWGETLAVGDLNADGYDDLVVGAPYEDVGAVEDAGAFTLVFGSSTGLRTTGSRQIHLGSAGVPGDPTEFTYFGYDALTVGDYNRDGVDDVAVGDGYGDSTGVVDSGRVFVFFDHGVQVLSENVGTIAGSSEVDDLWSYGALVTGDFNGDGFDDLAVGAAYEDVGTVVDAGTVTIIRGAPGGLTGGGSQQISRNTGAIPGSATSSTYWGYLAIAAGDFNGNGRDDLAIGSPYDTVNGASSAGSVTVLSGISTGVRTSSAKFFTADTPGVAGTAETNDLLSYGEITTADVNGDGRDDLIVGNECETVNGMFCAGALIILKGSTSGVTATGSVQLHEDSPGVPGTAEAYDYWMYSTH